METKDFREPFIPDRKVDYASQSIVSREVLHNEGGSITLFAFDEGQALSEHTAPFDAVLQVIDGRAAITVAGKEYVVDSGEMIMMPANIPHAVRADVCFKMMLTMIRS